MKKLFIIVTALMGLTYQASAHECLKEPPSDTARYSRHLAGHKGEKCWFESKKTRIAVPNTTDHEIKHTASIPQSLKLRFIGPDAGPLIIVPRKAPANTPNMKINEVFAAFGFK